jgi:heterodisulfide reductase subunit A-like polyferredoxin
MAATTSATGSAPTSRSIVRKPLKPAASSASRYLGKSTRPCPSVGGGIAGITAALNIADGGSKVYLVEKEPSIGGHMSQFDKTFPTLDCSACILTPKMTAVGQHPNIELLTCAEVANVDGYIGSFKVKIHKKARYVDIEKCTGCGTCWTLCPSRSTPRVKTIRIKTKFGDQLVRRAPNGNGSRR